jgi:hypothetical protein
MAVRCVGFGGVSGGSGGSPSRATMLYHRYFGINGTLFVWKVAVLQLLTVVLQAAAKLELLSMAVAMEGAVAPGMQAYGIFLKPMFWTFVCALLLNTIYPSVLLHSKRRGLQRDVVAAIDVLLDLIYFLAFCLAMFSGDGQPKLVPTDPFLYASNLCPLVRVVTTARAIETAALQRLEHRRSEGERLSHDATQDRAVARQRLPRWAAVGFFVLAGLACWAAFLFIGTRDRFPFSNGDECRPCTCSDKAMLDSCAIPATLGVRFFFIPSRGIRGIAPGAFGGFSTLKSLDLSRNNISSLPAGAFHGLGRITSLDLSANAIGTLGNGTFNGMPTLATLVLRDNPLAVLHVGALTGLSDLRNLFLDGSNELHMVELGAFADTPRVANVWMAGSVLNCSRLGLPGGVTCFDDVSCDVQQVTYIGDGVCDSDYADYETAACAWDGGDCTST